MKILWSALLHRATIISLNLNLNLRQREYDLQTLEKSIGDWLKYGKAVITAFE